MSGEELSPAETTNWSEAIEQATDVFAAAVRNYSQFLQRQASKMARGSFGVEDAAAAPVESMRHAVRSGVAFVQTAADNLALLSSGLGPAAPQRKVEKATVVVDLGKRRFGQKVTFEAGQLVGRTTGTRIDADRITLNPKEALAKGKLKDPSSFEVEVDIDGVPGDIYRGTIKSKVGTPEIVGRYTIIVVVIPTFT